MTWYSFEFWRLVLDVIGLCLCGVTIICLLRNRAEYNEKLLKRESPEKNPAGFHDVLVESLKRSETAFETVSLALKEERERLEGSQKKEDTDVMGEQYAEVSRLAEAGLGLKEISEKVDISKDEIELIMKLNKESGCMQ